MNEAPTFSAPALTTTILPFAGGWAGFSADGERLVFVTKASLVASDTYDDADVYVMDLATGTYTLVSEDAAGTGSYDLAFEPVFSPDGTKVAFVTKGFHDDSEKVYNNDIYIKDLLTGEITLVSTVIGGGASGDVHASSRAPVWSPDGTKIAFESTVPNLVEGDTDEASDIFIKDLTTGVITNLTSDGTGGAIIPVFSPDGSKIVYSKTSTQPGNSNYDLILEDLATGAITTISTVGPDNSLGGDGDPIWFDDLLPVFAPDGSLYFLSHHPYDDAGIDTESVYRLGLDGKLVETNLPQDLAFSPDGTLRAGSDGLVVDIATGATISFGYAGGFAFSPDSDKVAYATHDSLRISTLGSAAGASWTEGAAATTIVTFAQVADSDSADYGGGTLSAAITANAVAGDLLSLKSSRVTLSGDSVSVDGVVVGALSGTATSLSIALDADADDEAVEALTEAFRFSSTSDHPTAATREVTFTLVDGGGTADGGDDTTSFTRNVAVVPVNDEAKFTFTGSVVEGSEVGTVVGTVVVDDPDGPGPYTYTLLDNRGEFQIDSNGVITVKKSSIDYERGATIELNLRVFDGSGSYPLARPLTITVENRPEIIYGTSAADTLAVPEGNEGWTVFGMQGDDRLDGSAGNDRLNGARDNDELRGAGGNDLLEGGSGNDFLDGGTGSDTLDGGIGDDSYVVDNAGDAIVEREGEGTDSVRSSVSFALHSNVENLTLTGTGNTNATGNLLDNILIGNSGKNQLNGGGGADMMSGRAGDDSYFVNNAGDKAFEKENEGIDTVFASVTYSIAGQYIETLTLTGDALNATGNSLANIITGNDQANRIRGGLGADTMTGGFGDDTYFVDDVKDKVVELDGQGNDLVDSSISFSLAGLYVERLTLSGDAAINGTGNSFANIITGNNASNVIDGGTGADSMKGLNGDDRYIVDNAGDTVTETATGGRDTVESSVSFSLAGQYIEVLRLTGSAAIDGTGNNQANNLYGNTAANKLSAAGGDDKLFGGAGNDSLTGGTGEDHFVFDSALGGTTNVDKILDFVVADDTIDLDRSIFTAIGSGTLSASAFAAGTAAADADDRIVYDSATGNIRYDADGSGAGAAVLFANVTAGTILTNADFIAI